MEGGEVQRSISGKLLAVYYGVLLAAVAAVAALVVSIGDDEEAQPSIAGGYDLSEPNPCFGEPPAPPSGAPLPPTAPPQPEVAGPSFDVRQSGQFVNLTNTQGTLGGELRLEEEARPDGSRELRGEVQCVNGKTLGFEGFATAGEEGT